MAFSINIKLPTLQVMIIFKILNLEKKVCLFPGSLPFYFTVLSLSTKYANHYTIEYLLLVVFARKEHCKFYVFGLYGNFMGKNEMIKSLRKVIRNADSLKF